MIFLRPVVTSNYRKKIWSHCCFGMLFFIIAPSLSAFNSSVVSDYADEWAMKGEGERNPEYHDYGNNDCANFVSQCLIAGGMNLSQDENVWSWGQGGTIVNCDDMHRHLVEFQHAVVSTGTSASQAPANLCEGDVVIYGNSSDNYMHAVIAVSGIGSNVRLAAHSNNHNGEVGINYFITQYPNITFYHFSTATERGVDQEFYGTGRFYGLNTLVDVVLRQGTSYEGYIVNNLSDSDQDLVIGQNTSQLNGCAHYISAYCSDAHKGIPSQGQIFGQPWTSSDPNHWAYWVRQAVIYGNQNGFSSGDILESIWYITDRWGAYTQILSGIGYPTDGPDKNIIGSLGSITADSIKLFHNKFNPNQGENMTILYRIASAGLVKISIYTVDGTLVKTLLDDRSQTAGTYGAIWDGRNDLFETVASGIYLVHIQGPGIKATKKACVIK